MAASWSWVPIAFVVVMAIFPAAVGATTLYQNITALLPSQVAWFKPYSYYASAGYCNAAVTLTWNCGTNCEANPSFIPVASGGDGDSTQWCTSFVTIGSSFLIDW